MIFYDRGLLNSDMDLATSLWRRFFHASETINGPQLELLVKYVRQSMQMLDHIPTSDLMKGRQIKWLTLEDVNKDLQ